MSALTSCKKCGIIPDPVAHGVERARLDYGDLMLKLTLMRADLLALASGVAVVEALTSTGAGLDEVTRARLAELAVAAHRHCWPEQSLSEVGDG